MQNGNQSVIGVINLGTMGSNLFQNIADHGYDCVGYENDNEKVKSLNELNRDYIQGFSDLGIITENLKSSKTVMMLVLARKIVPANLIHVPRDYFGSHIYELKGKEGTFYTEWARENH